MISIQFPSNPVEGQVVDGFIYHEAWDNGSGFIKGPDWYPIYPKDLASQMAEVQWREDMEMMSIYEENHQ